MAIAIEKSARGQPNCSAIGIWNRPKLARMPKPTSRMMQLATSTGVISGALASVTGRALRNREADAATPGGSRSNANAVVAAITAGDGRAAATRVSPSVAT